MPYLIDSHEDLAYNMLCFGRDYRESALVTRQREENTSIPKRNGHTLLGALEYQQGNVRIIFGTLFLTPPGNDTPEWDIQCYHDFTSFRQLNQGQISAYTRLWEEAPDLFAPVRNRQELDWVMKSWDHSPELDNQKPHPTGIVMLMEGAEGINKPEELEEWWQAGVRMIGLVWAGGRLCGGTHNPGRFTREGLEFLEVMGQLGFTLDISHMSEESAAEALDRYTGPIVATHANARSLLKTDHRQRQLSDPVIQMLIGRNGIMGVIPFNHFLDSGYNSTNSRNSIRLEHLVAHIDHVCQLAGNSLHVGIGTDFDGGFGIPDVPIEIDTIADLHKLVPLLESHGYQSEDVQNILGGNWLRHLERTLPA